MRTVIAAGPGYPDRNRAGPTFPHPGFARFPGGTRGYGSVALAGWEAVCVEGLSRENLVDLARLQSTCLVESWAAQNPRSASSDSNFGIGFKLLRSGIL